MSLLTTFTDHNTFVNRHNGPTLEQQQTMLAAIGVDNLDQLIDQTVPANIRLPQPLQLPKAINEEMLLQQLKHIAQKNIINKSYIGQGYYNTYTPSVILRNILENP
ncbi:glycine dehydrogenase (aminomethyl-transferring), partial [Photobacterium damselae]